MRTAEDIIGISGCEIRSVERGIHTRTLIDARYSGPRSCIHCDNEQCRIKENYQRKLRHTRIGQSNVVLRVDTSRLYCQRCKKTFAARIPGVRPRYRATENFRSEVFENHQAGHSHRHLSKTRFVGATTIARWVTDFLVQRLKETKTRREVCPKFLGIDEHFFTRKKGYATSFIDLEKRCVFDVELGRSEKSLRAYLEKLKGRENVEVVLMDLSETYRSIIKKYFPNAVIVTDRFHVVRLVNQAFLKVWASLDPKGRKNRGLLRLMRMHHKNVPEKSRPKLEKYMKQNLAVAAVYEKKEALMAKLLLKTIGQYGAMKHVRREFGAVAVNITWTTDITYIRVDSGWLYLCVVLDVYSRRVVGWSLSTNIDTNLCSTALWNAWKTRGRPKGVIIHSDRGSQYTSETFQNFCTELGFKQSLSAVGSCYDNAVTESFFGSFKRELVYRLKLLNESEMRLKVFEWVEFYYNRKRIHSTLAYSSPTEYEEFAS